MPENLLRYIELSAIVVVLFIFGIVKFSHVTPEQRQIIVLEARLHQLYEFEHRHREERGWYFSPRSRQFHNYFRWLDEYDADVRSSRKRFSAVVRADLDGNGKLGVWRIDDTGPEVQVLIED